MFSKAALKLAELLPKKSNVLASNVNPVVVPEPNPSQKCPTQRTKPSFDISKVVIEPAHSYSAEEIERFLFIQHFKYQPTITNLRIDMNSNYLKNLAKKYSTTGDRWLAYQLDPKLRKRRLVGVLAAYKKFPWEIGRLDNWAAITPKPDSYHIHFCAHCLRTPDVFSKYRIPYVYDIELATTAVDTMGYGIEDLLLRTAFCHAIRNEHYPLIQVISINTYLDGACVRAGMTHEWSMQLADFTDENNQSLFYTKTESDEKAAEKYSSFYTRSEPDENATVNMYIRLFCPKKETILYHPNTLVKQNPVL